MPIGSIEQHGPHLPVQVDKIAGSSIDIFHKNPSHQRRILSDPNNLPYKANIKLGDETLSLSVFPMRDKSRNYLRSVDDFRMEFSGNDYSGEEQIVETLAKRGKFISSDRFDSMFDTIRQDPLLARCKLNGSLPRISDRLGSLVRTNSEASTASIDARVMRAIGAREKMPSVSAGSSRSWSRPAVRAVSGSPPISRAVSPAS
mgnify:CR=1 FL=1